jgi:hypothetical protein
MQHGSGDGPKDRWKHWLWMVACCVPMIALVVLGVWSIW